MLSAIITNLVGALVFLFLVWRRLREDYSKDLIFSLCFFVILGLALGFLISNFWVKSFWFWLEMGGVILGFLLSTLRAKLRFYESFEAVSLGFLAWFAVFWISVFIKTPSVTSFLASLLVISILVLFYLFDASYRNFTWYRSGRIGFSGLTTLAIFFLTRSAIASFFPFMLSFAGRLEVFFSGVASFILFLMVYNLSRQGL